MVRVNTNVEPKLWIKKNYIHANKIILKMAKIIHKIMQQTSIIRTNCGRGISFKQIVHIIKHDENIIIRYSNAFTKYFVIASKYWNNDSY